MYEELIKFETAKLAKDKGFTLATVGSHQYNYFKEDGTTGMVSWGHLNLSSPAEVPQSLLQKWLRDEHDIKVISDYDINRTKYFYWIIVDNETRGHSGFEMRRFNTWEEALELGLVEGLKLI